MRSRIAQGGRLSVRTAADEVASPVADAHAGGLKRRRRLRVWFGERRRRFPWRDTPEPWHVFVAEMLLRRTRAQQVAQHLPRILSAYPDPAAMATASPSEVRAALRPLGLVWRADTLKAAAEVIHRIHAGQVPVEQSALLSLPGVGPYVAFSVLTLLTNEDVLLTDANTVRVAMRVAGLELGGDVRRRARTQEALRDLLGGPAPAADWWAVLDLAAAVCRHRQPQCRTCPLSRECSTGIANVVNDTDVLPARP